MKKAQSGEKSIAADIQPDFRLLFTDNPLPMWVYDLKTLRFLAVNHAALEQYGYTRDEFLSMNITDIRPEPEQARLKADLRKKRPAPPNSSEWQHQRKDGTLFQVEIDSHTIEFEGHKAALVVAKNITQRKQSEQAYTALVEGSLQGVGLLQEGRLVFANQTMANILGYEVEELLQLSPEEVLALIHPEDRPKVAANIQARLAGKNPPEHYEMRSICKDGSLVWIELFSKALHYRGKPAVQFVMIDINTRKQAESALKESEVRYRGLFEAARDAIFLMEGDQFIECNPRALELFGVTREQIIKSNPYDHFSPPTQPDRRTSKEKALEKIEAALAGQAQFFEWTHQRLDGTLFEAEVSLNKVELSEHAYLLAFVRDISERKQAEEALRKSEASYREIFENAVEGIYRTSPEGQILAANPTLVKMLGYRSEEELKALNIVRDLYAKPDERDLETKSISRDGTIKNVEITLKRKDGQIISALDNARAIRDTHGKLLHYEGLLTDVTERKLAQQQVTSLSKFPAENPSPVLRIDKNGQVLFANKAGQAILRAWKTGIGKTIPLSWQKQVKALLEKNIMDAIDVAIEDQIYSIVFVPISDSDYVNLYGQDITERKQAEDILRRRVTELEVLYSTGLALSKSLDPHQIGQSIVEILNLQLNWHHAAIRLVHPDDRLELLAFSQPGMKDDDFQKEKKHLESLISKPGQGLSGWVLQHGEAVRSGDVDSDPRYVCTFPSIKSGLYAPMKVGERIIGTITVESEIPQAFDEHDERLLNTLASQSAIAFENARLFQDALAASQRREVLYDITQKIVYISQDSEQIYQAVYEAVATLMPAEAFVITLADHEKQDMEVVYLFYNGSQWPRQRVPLGQSMSGHVIQTGQSIKLDDTTAADVPMFRSETPDPVKSLLMVPLHAGERVIGALSTQSYTANAFTDDDLKLLEMLAAQTAIALENARLFEETHQRVEELGILAEVSAALRTAPTRAQMLPVVLEQLTKLIDAQGVAIAINDPQMAESLIEMGIGKWADWTGKRLPLNKGICNKINQSQKPYISQESGTDPLVVYPSLLNGLNAVGVFPLIAEHEMIGAIWVGREDQIQQTAIRVLPALADMVANAIRRAALHEQTARHADQMAAVSELGRTLAESLELSLIYQRLTKAIYNLMDDVAGMIISLYDPKKELITCVSAHIDGEFIDPASLSPIPLAPEGSGTQSRVIHTGKALVVNDLEKNIKKKVKVGNTQKMTESALYVPMIAEGRVIGLIQVQSYRNNRFSTEDAGLLSLVANTAAVAIENARLFGEVEERVEQLSALRAIDTAIGASAELRITLNILLDNVLRLLKVDAADILLFHPATMTLEYAAGTGFHSTAISRSKVRLGEGHAGKVGLERNLNQIMDLNEDKARFLRADLLKSEEFISYIGVPLVAKGQLKGILEVFQRSPLNPDESWKDFLQILAGQAAIGVDSAMLFDNLERANVELTMAYNATIEGWSKALELRDHETQGHTLRVTDMTLRLAYEMGIKDLEMEHIRHGVLLHDIGKMGIPDQILHKPGPLTDQEWTIMRTHPKIAHDLLASIAYLRPAVDIPYCHHEKWDGSGYPRGLKSETIPLPARIFAVIDVYDALTNDRPYRVAWTHEKALQHIRDESGKHFDPEVVETFLKLIESDQQ
jgi:PAS domain S-box-containing protein